MTLSGIRLTKLLLIATTATHLVVPVSFASTTVPEYLLAFDNLTDENGFKPREGIIIGGNSGWTSGPVFVPAQSGKLQLVEGAFGAIDPGFTMTMTLREVSGDRPGAILDQVSHVVPVDVADAAILEFTGWTAEIKAEQQYFLQAGQELRGSFWALAVHDPQIGDLLGEFRVRNGTFDVYGPLDLSLRVNVGVPDDTPTPVPVPPVGPLLLVLFVPGIQRVFSVRRRLT